MVPTICAVGETRENTIVSTSPSTSAPATRNKLTTPNLGSAQSGSSNFIGHLPTAALSPDVAQIIRASWRVSTHSAYNTPMRGWLDFCNRRKLNPHQPTVSQVLDFFHTLHELGLSYSGNWDTPKCNKCNSRDPRSPATSRTLVSVPVYERNLVAGPPQTRYIKTWDFNKVLSYLKSLEPNHSFSLKQLTLKPAALLTREFIHNICSVL